MKKLIIFGSNGMLGNYIKKYFKKNNKFCVISINRKDYDVMKNTFEDLENILLYHKIGKNTIVFNAIGIIPQASKNYELNDRMYIKINCLFPNILSMLCNKYEAKMIHPTTDCVYSGKKGNYIENDFHDEISIYGMSKSLGEPYNCTVLRTSIIGEEKFNKRSLLEWVKTNN